MALFDRMLQARQELGMHICIIIDFDLKSLPVSLKGAVFTRANLFLQKIIHNTHIYARVFKINAACFQAFGNAMNDMLAKAVGYVKKYQDGSIPVVIDFTGVEDSNKSNDIGPSNGFYGADAVIYRGAISYRNDPKGSLANFSPNVMPNFTRLCVDACAEYRKPESIYTETQFAQAARRVARLLNESVPAIVKETVS